MAITRAGQLREASNPLFSDRKLKLGTMLGINSQTLPPGVEQQLKAHFIAGWGGFPLVGTKEQVVDGLALLAKVGFDGVILSWARYIEEMRQFRSETYPLLEQVGLR
jgi:alkanesulfonate monooxygenase SsuD/methylene tetrahydromethanopterin reductase-like flavin-dependent oxidoreductase (luciferase family)